MPVERMKSRIAPTPSGFLHAGNLCSFIRTWLSVRRAGGSLLLRIDDIDNERSRPEYLEDIFHWLQLMGLDYDEGPRSAEDFKAHWSQMLRLPLYERLLDQLAATGQVYACTCSRKHIAQHSPNGLYHGECRTKQLPLNAPDAVWRLQVPATAQVQWQDEIMGACSLQPAALMGDFVIRRRNGLPAYQVASLADDLHFGINYIVRGQDLLASTSAQLYMAQLTGAKAFQETQFCHHLLIMDEAGHKLSKSAGHGAIQSSQDDRNPTAMWTLLQHICDTVPAGSAIQTARDLL